MFSPDECARILAHDSPWSPAQVSDGFGKGTSAGDKRASSAPSTSGSLLASQHF
ncbi:hypothetical protein [Enhygromyxa salina]|uniref:hypothetical protein n=1 Tax=Enhygromyxa salina TaxID=215803 RepID=UPI0015E67176|nr:hypothetical protein [Enhygromyxa salina]